MDHRHRPGKRPDATYRSFSRMSSAFSRCDDKPGYATLVMPLLLFPLRSRRAGTRARLASGSALVRSKHSKNRTISF
ncbi:hypothetical protein C7S14_3027 [Burkholderia cepacia]|nr:hypothetical protein C7S14_3027 [Burkholderia cepacia]